MIFLVYFFFFLSSFVFAFFVYGIAACLSFLSLIRLHLLTT